MRIKKIVAMLLCASVFFTGVGVTNCVGYAVESTESPEKDMKANSWRFSDGQPIEQGRSVQMYSAESDSSNAWRKVNGRYVNSKGEVIPGAEKKGIDVSEWNEKTAAPGPPDAAATLRYQLKRASLRGAWAGATPDAPPRASRRLPRSPWSR